MQTFQRGLDSVQGNAARDTHAAVNFLGVPGIVIPQILQYRFFEVA